MTAATHPSAAVARLLAFARDGGMEPQVEHGADGTGYRFTGFMPEQLREAGFAEPGIDYFRSAGAPEEEGFVEEDSDTWLFFPVDPAHDLMGDIARQAVREQDRPRWPSIVLAVAGFVALIAAAIVGNSTTEAALVAIATLLLVGAFALRRRV